MSLQVAALLCCLIIGAGTAHSAAVKKTRIARADTRTIPSNMFKPLGEVTHGNQNSSLSSDYPDLSLSEHATGEAHAVTYPPITNRRIPVPEEDDYDQYQPSRNTNRFHNSPIFPIQDQFLRGSQMSNFNDRSSRFGSSGFNGPQFGSSGSQFGSSGSQFGTSGSQFGYSGPNLGQTIPLIGSGFISPDPFNPSSSSNFYRSESYSYSSDGNGPPQVERNVYDSRLGHGISSRNF